MGVPLAPAVVGDASGLLSTVTTLFVLMVAATAWVLARRRRRAGAVVASLALLALAAAWLPPAERDAHAHVTGFLEGEASFLVRTDDEAPPLALDGGEGRLAPEGEGLARVHLSCPARCAFRIGHEPAFGPLPPVAAGDDDGLLRVRIEGGPLLVRATLSHCLRVPLALRLLAEPGCLPCHEKDFLVGRGASGETTLRASPGPAC